MPFATMPFATSPIAASGDGVGTSCVGASCVLPKLRCSATAFANNKALLRTTLPKIVASGGAVGVGHAHVFVKIQALVVRAQTGCVVQAQLPLLAANAGVLSGLICSGQPLLPRIAAKGRTGASGRAKLPKLRSLGSTTSTCVFHAVVAVPNLIATASATVTIPVVPDKLICKAQLPNMVVVGRSGVKAKLHLAKVAVVASATSGGVAFGTLKLHPLRAAASCRRDNVLTAQLVLPKIGVIPRAYVRAKLPNLTVTAQVFGARGLSETWVVNLKHDPHSPPTGEADVDEVTTYTNYDFEQIVRNGDDYYGVGARGVFRLGKVADDDTGVPQTTTTTTTPGVPGTTVVQNTGLIIPWYIYPDGAATGTDAVLNSFLVERAKHPNVDVQVIVNPNNGVGFASDANYQALIDALVANNCTPLAYIPTTYGTRSLVDVKAEVVRWDSLYTGVVGVFYDEASNTDTQANIAYYSELTAYAHAMGYTPICINAGIGVPNSFYATPTMFDEVVVYENNQYQQTGDLINQPSAVRNKRCVMVYNNPFVAQKVTELVAHARWVYVSDCGAGYDTLPTYIGALFSACEPTSTTVGGTPPTTVTTTAGGAIPVEFYFKTGLHDFRSQTQKTIVSAYMAGRINGGVIVELFPGENAKQPQKFTTPRGNTVQNYRQRFPLGNKFRYYAFGIGGNTPFVLDGLSVELANLTRRV